MDKYPKRLIEVDLPIKRISAHARREKSIRHGHISTLHIWWARRPLAACRAVICASLWPDPADPLCPKEFRTVATQAINTFVQSVVTTKTLYEMVSEESLNRYRKVADKNLSINPEEEEGWMNLRTLLLDFIADFANWDASIETHFLEMARTITQSAHEALGGEKGTRPLVVDPFAGGGAIPLEALRTGADTFASDLNPVAVLLNKVVLEYIPKYGERLADTIREWGEWIKNQTEKELMQFYPKGRNGFTPITYLWARTVKCEGPSCGATVPLIRSLWLAKKGRNSIALKLVPHPKARRVDLEILDSPRAGDVTEGTVKRGSTTCPCCGFTTPVSSVRTQLKKQRGGASNAMLLCVVETTSIEQGRFYRLPCEKDLIAVREAQEELERQVKLYKGPLPPVPDEPTPMGGGRGAGRAFSQRNYGMDVYGDLFSSRQLLSMMTLVKYVRKAGEEIARRYEDGFATAVQSILALLVDKQADLCNALCAWEPIAQCPRHLFGRQAIGMVWDFAEGVPISESSGGFKTFVDGTVNSLTKIGYGWNVGNIERANAAQQPLPDDTADCFFTDPPYYDAVPYADLSDFFYVWLKRTLPDPLVNLWFLNQISLKDEECVVDEVKGHDQSFFEHTMAKAMSEGRRVLVPRGIGIIVFAHKTTAGWESQLQAMVDAGWVITGSWPVDTECGSRLRAMNSAALASSVHLVCRPRENSDGP